MLTITAQFFTDLSSDLSTIAGLFAQWLTSLSALQLLYFYHFFKYSSALTIYSSGIS